MPSHENDARPRSIPCEIALRAAFRKAEHALDEALGRGKVREMAVPGPMFEFCRRYQVREHRSIALRDATAVERQVRRAHPLDGAPDGVPKLLFVAEEREPHAAEHFAREAPRARAQAFDRANGHLTEAQVREHAEHDLARRLFPECATER